MDKNSSHCAKGVCADRTAANRFRWMWLVRVLCAGYRAIREDCLGGSVGYCWWLLLMTIWMVTSRRFSRVDRSRMTIDLKERRLRLPARGSLPRSDGLIRWSDRTAHWSIANLRRSKVLVVSCGEYSVEKIAPYALRRGVRIRTKPNWPMNSVRTLANRRPGELAPKRTDVQTNSNGTRKYSWMLGPESDHLIVRVRSSQRKIGFGLPTTDRTHRQFHGAFTGKKSEDSFKSSKEAAMACGENCRGRIL